MPSVEFTADNILKCECGRCPVQAKSDCVDKARGASAKAVEEGHVTRQPSEVPGLYCSSGKAFCDDLDLSQNCMCGQCTVHAEYKLSQSKYCQRGSAQSIET